MLRVKIRNSSVSTGAGLTGLTSASSGLIISTIADNEATATAYTVAGSTIESITTLGTYSAPTATKCRFKEVDSTNHKGIYEIQIADARFAVSSAKSVLISISGATNAAECDALVPLTSVDPYDATAFGVSRLDAAVSSRMATYTQPTGFLAATFPSGTVASTTNITAGTITTTTNLTNLPSIPTNWLTAAGIAASALNGKGDWGTATNLGTVLTRVTTALPSVAPGGVNGLPILGTNTAGLLLNPAAGVGLDIAAPIGIRVVSSTDEAVLLDGFSQGLHIKGDRSTSGAAAVQITGVTGTGITCQAGALFQSLDGLNYVSFGDASGYGVLVAGATDDIFLVHSDAPTLATAIVGAAGAALTALAPASTALSTATWTNARAANLDNLNAAVSTRAVAGDAMTLTSGERDSIADAHIARNIAGGSSTGRTVKDVYAAIRNKVAIVGTTMTVYATDDTTSLWTATLTTDGTAVPITAMDPA